MVNSQQRTVNFTINTPGWVAFDVVVKGGTNSNHYDYSASAVGPQTSDTVLHSPPKGNRYDNLSHVTICYDEPPPVSISGTKFHDRDTDGVLDNDNGEVEEGLANWTIMAFQGGDEVASAVTDTDGATTTELGTGTYVVCEVLRRKRHHSTGSNRPHQETNLHRSWKRSEPGPGGPNRNPLQCPRNGQLRQPPRRRARVRRRRCPVGNHRRGRQAVGHGDAARRALPAQAYPFDVGVSPDEEFAQFVVFGGAPDGTVVFTEEIDWLPYGSNYLPNGIATDPADPGRPPTGWRGGGGRQLRSGAAQRRCPRLPSVVDGRRVRNPAPIPSSTSRSTSSRSGSSWVTPPGASGKQQRCSSPSRQGGGRRS